MAKNGTIIDPDPHNLSRKGGWLYDWWTLNVIFFQIEGLNNDVLRPRLKAQRLPTLRVYYNRLFCNQHLGHCHSSPQKTYTFKHYCPVSNLNFLSKVTEKAVAFKIMLRIWQFNLDNCFQSAYKAYHTTETALLTVQNNIFLPMEKQDCTALTLLDLSAVFDTMIIVFYWTDWNSGLALMA